MNTPLRSIPVELAGCRAAFAAHPDAIMAFCVHDGILYEPLTGAPEVRIAYILDTKHESQHAVRFRNFRPFVGYSAESWAKVVKTRAEAFSAWDEARKTVAKPSKAWDEACRLMDEACKSMEVDALHDAQWPDHTWNGTGIFTP